MSPRVLVLGYGVIGRRVVDAVARQPDLRPAGVVVRSISPALLAADPTLPVFRFDESMDHALAGADVVVDCGQRGTGRGRFALYRASRTRAVFCGGEHDGGLGPLVSAGVNYDSARDRPCIRVASCNTTGLARAVNALQPLGLERVQATVVRASTDPDKSHKGHPGDVVVTPGRSHHADDLLLLFPGVDVHTQALSVATARGHVFTLAASFSSRPSVEAVRATLGRSRRIVLREGTGAEPLVALHQPPGLHRRGDEHRLVVWDESLWVQDRILYMTAFIHMEAITIPDLVDGVRAVSRPEVTAAESLQLTDQALALSLP